MRPSYGLIRYLLSQRDLGTKQYYFYQTVFVAAAAREQGLDAKLSADERVFFDRCCEIADRFIDRFERGLEMVKEGKELPV